MKNANRQTRIRIGIRNCTTIWRAGFQACCSTSTIAPPAAERPQQVVGLRVRGRDRRPSSCWPALACRPPRARPRRAASRSRPASPRRSSTTVLSGTCRPGELGLDRAQQAEEQDREAIEASSRKVLSGSCSDQPHDRCGRSRARSDHGSASCSCAAARRRLGVGRRDDRSADDGSRPGSLGSTRVPLFGLKEHGRILSEGRRLGGAGVTTSKVPRLTGLARSIAFTEVTHPLHISATRCYPRRFSPRFTIVHQHPGRADETGRPCRPAEVPLPGRWLCSRG